MHIVRKKETGTRTGPHEGALSAPLKLIGTKAVETYCFNLNSNPVDQEQMSENTSWSSFNKAILESTSCLLEFQQSNCFDQKQMSENTSCSSLNNAILWIKDRILSIKNRCVKALFVFISTKKFFGSRTDE